MGTTMKSSFPLNPEEVEVYCVWSLVLKVLGGCSLGLGVRDPRLGCGVSGSSF